MARSRSEAHAITRASAVLQATVDRSGGATFRVVIDHQDADHDVLPVAAHYGPSYNAGWAETVAQVKGVPVADIDLLEEARTGAQRAHAEYPADAGYLVAIETLVPADDGETAKWRRVE